MVSETDIEFDQFIGLRDIFNEFYRSYPDVDFFEIIIRDARFYRS
jgi:hypothetical protein